MTFWDLCSKSPDYGFVILVVCAFTVERSAARFAEATASVLRAMTEKKEGSK